MPKRNRRSKRMRGGMWPFSSSDGTDSSSSSGDGWFGSLKKNASSASGWLTSGSATPTTTTPSYTGNTASTYGGRKRKSRRMRGGYSDNVSLTNLASRAAPYSGETARAQAYVGGRTRRRCHKHKGSHRRHCRK
jgi:hypothetical protein